MKTRQHHVLYIEDHEDTRELITLVLSERNYRVTTGNTVADGLKLARKHPFDLYILDSWLPDGLGIDLCKSLREFNPGIPIMFFSGAAYKADKETAINSGAQAYLVKPVDLDVLCGEVSKLIGRFPRKLELVEVRARTTSNVRRLSEDRAAFEPRQPFIPRLRRLNDIDVAHVCNWIK